MDWSHTQRIEAFRRELREGTRMPQMESPFFSCEDHPRVPKRSREPSSSPDRKRLKLSHGCGSSAEELSASEEDIASDDDLYMAEIGGSDTGILVNPSPSSVASQIERMIRRYFKRSMQPRRKRDTPVKLPASLIKVLGPGPYIFSPYDRWDSGGGKLSKEHYMPRTTEEKEKIRREDELETRKMHQQQLENFERQMRMDYGIDNYNDLTLRERYKRTRIPQNVETMDTKERRSSNTSSGSNETVSHPSPSTAPSETSTVASDSAIEQQTASAAITKELFNDDVHGGAVTSAAMALQTSHVPSAYDGMSASATVSRNVPNVNSIHGPFQAPAVVACATDTPLSVDTQESEVASETQFTGKLRAGTENDGILTPAVVAVAADLLSSGNAQEVTMTPAKPRSNAPCKFSDHGGFFTPAAVTEAKDLRQPYSIQEGMTAHAEVIRNVPHEDNGHDDVSIEAGTDIPPTKTPLKKKAPRQGCKDQKKPPKPTPSKVEKSSTARLTRSKTKAVLATTFQKLNNAGKLAVDWIA